MVNRIEEKAINSSCGTLGYMVKRVKSPRRWRTRGLLQIGRWLAGDFWEASLDSHLNSRYISTEWVDRSRDVDSLISLKKDSVSDGGGPYACLRHHTFIRTWQKEAQMPCLRDG
jgi:hypothetical protein